MEKQNYKAIGVMSGTSLDGIDLAELSFTWLNGKWSYTIGKAQTIPYDSKWRMRLQQAIHASTSELELLNKEYSLFVSQTIARFIESNCLKKLDFIASHGHTVLHQPDQGITLQIGNLPEIKTYLPDFPVICDFRVQDVALGGQGAPLVPIGDALLFSSYTYCINLGGFSNLSFQHQDKRRAFDICPVNSVLNHYAQKLGYDYDKNGRIAAQGQVNSALLNALNKHPFYALEPPKSLGLEFVLTEMLPLIASYKLPVEDVLKTYLYHIVDQISAVCTEVDCKILITGGGAHHQLLLQLLQEKLFQQTLVVPDAKTIDFKEALIFAFLGVLKWRNEINIWASVTGAAHDHSSGKIYY